MAQDSRGPASHADLVLMMLTRILNNQARHEFMLRQVTRKIGVEMATVKEIADKVTAIGDVEQGVVTLLDDISQRLKDAQNDPAAMQLIIDDLDKQKTALADAVVRNTPVAPSPTPTPAP